MAIDYFYSKPKTRRSDHLRVCSNIDKNIEIVDTTSSETDDSDPKKNGILLTADLLQLKGPIKIVWWENPQCIYVIPADPEFRTYHDKYHRPFMERSRDNLSIRKDEVAVRQKFRNGEICFFRDYTNRNLGPWLRGVVLKTPEIPIFDWHQYSAKEGYRCSEQELSAILDQENFVYQIRSIDYGFKVYKSAINMRKVINHNDFRDLAPWALRCSLYGVYPVASDIEPRNPGGFSDLAIEMMDSWIRGKILDIGSSTSFYMLLKSKMRRRVDDSTKIILLHKTTLPMVSIEQGQTYKLACLNADMVNQGLATDTDPESGKSAHIFIEQYLVDMLFSRAQKPR